MDRDRRVEQATALETTATSLAPAQQTASAHAVDGAAQFPPQSGTATARPSMEPRASGGRKKPKEGPVIPAEAIAIMDAWDSLFKHPQPRTEQHVQAAILLVSSQPTKDDLKQCKGWLFTTDDPRKPWYRKHGVKLIDVAKNYTAWQSVQPEQEEEAEPEPYSVPWFIRNQERARAGLQA